MFFVVWSWPDIAQNHEHASEIIILSHKQEQQTAYEVERTFQFIDSSKYI